jgi:hypothetical protein
MHKYIGYVPCCIAGGCRDLREILKGELSAHIMYLFAFLCNLITPSFLITKQHTVAHTSSLQIEQK